MIHALKIRDEKGFTTAGMAVSLLVSIALMFSGAQLYRVHSASAEIQEVADAASLAAENEVAEFETAANMCDSICLTFTLFSATMYGLGIVCACIPPTAVMSEKFIEVASNSLKARKKFYDSAIKGLNYVQKLLPFLAAANAMGVSHANDEGAMQAEYFAVAALVPPTGVDIAAIENDGLDSVGENIEGGIDELKEASNKAEEASKQANDAKVRGFEADCGHSTKYSMRERASKLSSIGAVDNPDYASVDTWSFSVALERARAYYKARLDDWHLSGDNIEEKADSVLRKKFYRYATERLEDAYVHDSDSFECNIPKLFSNTEELRETELYTEKVYPITSNGSSMTMHAWAGCPNASGSISLGSVQDLDKGSASYDKCSKCEFTVSSLGNVAAASTSISNGFEHHYELMREAALDYKKARDEADPLCSFVKDTAGSFIDSLSDILKNASQRIHIDPPGKYGAISMVVNNAHNPADTGFESAFVSGGTTLGTRVAVSGATVIDDDTEKVTEVISDKLRSLTSPVGVIAGIGAIATDFWSSMLTVYQDGQAALTEGVETALNAISTTTSSGLGKWASGFLQDAIKALGLEPANLQSRKPMLINTGHIASADSSGFSVTFSNAKAAARSASTSSTGFMGSIVSKISGDITDAIDGADITIAGFSLPFIDNDCSIGWVLPDAISQSGGGLTQAIADLMNAGGSVFGSKVWQ